MDQRNHEPCRLNDESEALERAKTTNRHEYTGIGRRGMGRTRLGHIYGHTVELGGWHIQIGHNGEAGK